MKITAKYRAKILLSLPKGYAKAVAAICKVSEKTVYDVLHHGQENLAVALALIKLATDNKIEMQKAHNDARQLMKQL
jgi:hypothetical protein